MNEYVFNSYDEVIFKFIDTICKRFPKIDYSRFFKKLHTLKIVRRGSEEQIKGNIYKCASYNRDSNVIYILSKKENKYIYHELFHLLSSLRQNCSGFKTYTRRGQIGEGLNEGYTELLSNRYFTYGENNKSYVYERKCASIIESILTENVMFKLYAESNLEQLIDCLEEYMPKNMTLRFIKNLDDFSKNWYNDTIISKGKSKKSYIECNDYLSTLIYSYYKKQYLNRKISYDEMIRQIKNKISILLSNANMSSIHNNLDINDTDDKTSLIRLSMKYKNIMDYS